MRGLGDWGGLGPGWALEVISRWFRKRSRELGLRGVTKELQYLWSSDDVGEAWGIRARLGFRGHLKIVSEKIRGIGFEGSHERIAISLEQR